MGWGLWEYSFPNPRLQSDDQKTSNTIGGTFCKHPASMLQQCQSYEKGRQRNCQFGDMTEMWWLDAIWHSNKILGWRKDTHGKTDEIWIKSGIDSIVLMLNFLVLMFVT